MTTEPLAGTAGPDEFPPRMPSYEETIPPFRMEDRAVTTASTVSNLAERLAAELRGRVVTPADDDYDALRHVVEGSVDHRPALIARVADAADVATVLRFARESGLELAVRSGGHSGAGHGTTEGGIVLDVRELDAIEIDVDGRTTWVGSGATAGAVTTALTAHGLAVGFGDTGSVGVGGLTTGGGIGYLVRKHGMTIDALRAAEVVTADGSIRTVDAETEPDLFWAIRGAGANVGVVTRFQFALQRVPAIVGGMMILPATPEAVAGFVAAADAAPEELSTIANVMPCPPMPFVPKELHGTLVNMALMCYAGEAGDAADAAYAPFRALGPLADMIKPGTLPDMYFGEEGAAEMPPMVVAMRQLFIDRVDVPAATSIVEALAASDSPMRAVQLRVLGGQMARVPADATAFAHRSAPIMAIVVALIEAPEARERREAWVGGLVSALDQGVPGAYVNFVNDEGPERVHDAYPAATWERLAAVKATYDPDNLFRRNQNVPPKA
jgi:FAD/FMN-containing dehydrogenase